MLMTGHLREVDSASSRHMERSGHLRSPPRRAETYRSSTFFTPHYQHIAVSILLAAVEFKLLLRVVSCDCFGHFRLFMIKITGILRTFTSRLGFGLNCLGVIVCLGKCFTISNNTIEVGVGVLGTCDFHDI
jgi:hypothetical protein